MPDVLDYKWELYNLNEDYSEFNDLAAKMPDKLKEMKDLFTKEAGKYQVFPLDNSVLPRVIAPRPSSTAGRTVFTYSGEMPGLPSSDAPSILNKSYNVTAEIEIPKGGAEGMLVTEGGRFGGYGLYLLKSKPVFLYNFVDLQRFRWEGPALQPGKHTVTFDFKYDGPGFGKGGTGVLTVDGKEVANEKIPHTTPFIITIDETFDVGSDTRTSVADKDYQVPFRFTGTLNKLTVKLEPPQLSAAEQSSWRKKCGRSRWRSNKTKLKPEPEIPLPEKEIQSVCNDPSDPCRHNPSVCCNRANRWPTGTRSEAIDGRPSRRRHHCLREILARTTKRIRVPPLAVGLGIYLPTASTLMIVVGSVVGWIYDRSADRTRNPEGAKQLGVLLASGLIVGESIIGVVISAIVVFSGKAAPLALVGPNFGTAAIIIGGLAFAIIAFVLYRWTLRMTTGSRQVKAG